MLLNGRTPTEISHLKTSKAAKSGGKAVVKDRVAGIYKYLEKNIRSLVAQDFYRHFARYKGLNQT